MKKFLLIALLLTGCKTTYTTAFKQQSTVQFQGETWNVIGEHYQDGCTPNFVGGLILHLKSLDGVRTHYVSVTSVQ